MTRIIDFCGNDADRTVTVATLLAQKEASSPFTQVTAASAEEAAAADEAGIEMVVCLDPLTKAVREGSSKLFVTAAIDFSGAVTDDELLSVAYDALSAGADAVITARRFQAVRRIADEGIPVMGHLGFVPKHSTWYGGVRAVGKTAAEATELWEKFLRLEEAGAFGVECELIPSQLMNEINQRTGLVTVSLGSGPSADVMFLFTSDICGETSRTPRHARAYGNIAALQQQIKKERIDALTSFRKDVAAQEFPSEGEMADIPSSELDRFLEAIRNRENH